MKRAFILILGGAILWGTIGFYVKYLYYFGFSPMEVVTLRVGTAAFILLIYLSIVAPKQLKLLQWTDIRYFLGTGILSIIFFNYCLFKTMELSSISVATALLYTGPAFVIILSYFLFKEPITRQKFLALITTLIGIALVVELFPLSLTSMPILTILIGLGSGLGYALYSIFSKFALKKYSGLVITTYTFVIAAITLVPFFPFKEHVVLFTDIKVLLFAFGLGFLPTAVAYIIYTYGLHATEASNASLITTVEPVVATLIGIVVFNEGFKISQVVGMVCIIGAVILMQVKFPSKKQLLLAKEKES